MLALDPRGEIAAVGHEHRAIEMPHIGRQPLHPEDEMAAQFGFDIEPQPGLQIEPGADRMAPQRLQLGILDRTAERAFAFGFDHQPVDIAAIPALQSHR